MSKGSEWEKVRWRIYRCGLRRLRLWLTMLHNSLLNVEFKINMMCEVRQEDMRLDPIGLSFGIGPAYLPLLSFLLGFAVLQEPTCLCVARC